MKTRLLAISTLALAAACGGSDDGGAGAATHALRGTATLAGLPSSAGLVVTLVGPRTAATTTDDVGAFAFPGLPDGTYSVTVAGPSTLQGSRTVAVVVAGGDASAPPLALTPVGRLTGRVTLGAATGNAGISVIVAGTSAAGTTDDAGGYVIDGVPSGSRDVVATLPGYAAAVAPAVGVPWDGTAIAPDLALSPGGRASIEGSAFLAGGGPAVGATVTVDGTSFSTTVADDGTFAIEGLPDGAWTVTIDAGDWFDRIPGVITVAGGRGYLLDGNLYPMLPVDLPRGRRLSGAYGGGTVSVAPGGAHIAFPVGDGPGTPGTLMVAPIDGDPRQVAHGAVPGTISWSANGGALAVRTSDPMTGVQAVLSHDVATGRTSEVLTATNPYSIGFGWLQPAWGYAAVVPSAGVLAQYTLFGRDGTTIPLGTAVSFPASTPTRLAYAPLVDQATAVRSLWLADLVNGAAREIAGAVAGSNLFCSGGAGICLFWEAPAAGKGTLKALRMESGEVTLLEADSTVGQVHFLQDGSGVLLFAGGVARLVDPGTLTLTPVATNVGAIHQLGGGRVLLYTDTIPGTPLSPTTYTLRVLDVATGVTAQVATGASHAFQSPDRAHLAFFRDYVPGSTSYTLGLYTYATQALSPSVATGVRSTTQWTSDGSRLVFASADGAVRSCAPGGPVVTVAAATPASWVVTADSQNLIVFRTYASGAYATVALAPLGGGGETTVATNAILATRTADGAVLYFLAGYSQATFSGTLRAVRVADATAVDMATGAHQYALAPSPDGAGIVFGTGYDAATGACSLYVAAAFATTRTSLGPAGICGSPVAAWSPDGQYAIVRTAGYRDADNVTWWTLRAAPAVGGAVGGYVGNVSESGTVLWTGPDRFYALAGFTAASGKGSLLSAAYTPSGPTVVAGSTTRPVQPSDRSRLAFLDGWTAERGTGALMVLELATGRTTPMLDRAASFQWFLHGSENRLFVHRTGTPPPFRFQDGAYVTAALP